MPEPGGPPGTGQSTWGKHARVGAWLAAMDHRRPRPPRREVSVDDGLATGSTMRAAVQALRQEAPTELVIAVPVAAAATCTTLRQEADEVVCARTPEPFIAVGLWYADFSETSDDEVRDLLAQARTRPRASMPGAH